MCACTYFMDFIVRVQSLRCSIGSFHRNLFSKFAKGTTNPNSRLKIEKTTDFLDQNDQKIGFIFKSGLLYHCQNWGWELEYFFFSKYFIYFRIPKWVVSKEHTSDWEILFCVMGENEKFHFQYEHFETCLKVLSPKGDSKVLRMTI